MEIGMERGNTNKEEGSKNRNQFVCVASMSVVEYLIDGNYNMKTIY